MAEPLLPTIAINGIGCRFPGGVKSPVDFWDLLVSGQNTWSDVPSDRFEWKSFHHSDPNFRGAMNHRGGHFLEHDIALFDTDFFGISPTEARCIDPQQRILFETTFEALENAGIPLELIKGSDTGVFVSMFSQDYERMMYKDPDDVPKYQASGTDCTFLSNRLSYLFDLHGPSLTVNTACSGSLVALHLACQSLAKGETNRAVVGGVNLILSPDAMIGLSNLHILNRDGKSYAFDARGAGYGRGEGAAVIVLERLQDALAADNPIRAIIHGTSVNHNGRTAGITLPDQSAQESLIRTAYKQSIFAPQDVGYVEAHGTGTVAGDFAELSAIGNTFCEGRHPDQILAVGSVKSSIGHLESASGLAGIIKAVLILEKGIIPPVANIEKLKSGLPLKSTIKIPIQCERWSQQGARVVSVNSFGFGGTNAHALLTESCGTGSHCSEPKNLSRADNRMEKDVLLSENVAQSLKPSQDIVQLFVLTAKSKESLQEQIHKLALWVSASVDTASNLCDLAFTLGMRRSHFPWRYNAVTTNKDELVATLHASTHQGIKSFRETCLTYVFTGQGAQWYAMGRRLIEISAVFERSLAASDRILHELGASWSLIEEMQREKNISRINVSEIAMPSSTSLQIALVDLLDSLGCKPTSVIGYSSGEIAAAYCVGALSHENALKVSYQRSVLSALSEKLVGSRGRMIAVALGEDEVAQHLKRLKCGVVSVACINSPCSTTVSGDEPAILELKQLLDEAKVFNRILQVDTAYHSHHMRKVSEHYLKSLDDIHTYSAHSSIKFVSSVTAQLKTTGFGPAYWDRNLTSTVRYLHAVETYCGLEGTGPDTHSKTFHLFLEVGPHSALSVPTQQTLSQPKYKHLKHAYLSTLIRGSDAHISLLKCLGKLFEYGYKIDIGAINSIMTLTMKPQVLQTLPPYPWNHSTRFWQESRISREHRFRQHPYHDLLGVRIVESSSLEPIWRIIISAESHPWLRDHVVDNFTVFPGAGFLCMAVEAMRQVSRDYLQAENLAYRQFHLREVRFLRSLILPQSPDRIEVQLSLRTSLIPRSSKHNLSAESMWQEFRISATSEKKSWQEYCTGLIAISPCDRSACTDRRIKPCAGLDGTANNHDWTTLEVLSHEDLYSKLLSCGNVYGPTFARINALNVYKSSTFASLSAPDIVEITPGKMIQPHIIHPTVLDAIMHSSIPLLSRNGIKGSVMPVSVAEVTICMDMPSNPGVQMTAQSKVSSLTPRSGEVDITVASSEPDSAENVVIQFSRMELRGLGETTTGIKDNHTRDMSYRMHWKPDVDFLAANSFASEVASLDHCLRLLHFKQARVKILCIHMTAGDLPETLRSSEANYLANVRFDFPQAIDSNPSRAQTRFLKGAGTGDLKYLDVHKDPLKQGYPACGYDVLICRRSILPNVSTDIFKLLRKGGIFVEADLDSDSDPDTKRSSVEDGSINNGLASASSITSNSVDINGRMSSQFRRIASFTEHAAETGAVLRSTVWYFSNGHTISSATKFQVLEYSKVTTSATDIIRTLENSAASMGSTLQMKPWGSYDLAGVDVHIVLDSIEKPLLASLTAGHFDRIKLLVRSAASVLWVTIGQSRKPSEASQNGLILGFARSCRAEYPHLRFMTFNVEGFQSSFLALQNALSEMMFRASSPMEVSNEDLDFAYRDGKVLVSRLLPDNAINMWVKDQMLHETARPAIRFQHLKKVLTLSSSKEESPLISVEAAPQADQLGPNDVEISLRACSLDGSSEDSTLEARSDPIIQEIAGTVIGIGSNMQNQFKVNDRVVGWNVGLSSFSSRLRVPGANIRHLPSSISFSDGVCSLMALIAAHHGMIRIGNLQKGHKVLISCTDLIYAGAALQIANLVGANVFLEAENSDQKQSMEDLLQVRADDVIELSEEKDFDLSLRDSRDQGFDVVFRQSGSSVPYGAFYNLIAPLGVFIDVHSPVGPYSDELGRLCSTRRDITYASFSVGSLSKHRPLQVDESFSWVISQMERGLRPRYNFPSMLLGASNDSLRKEVMEAENDSVISGHKPKAIPQGDVDDQGLYVVAGGSGDLGRQICTMLAQYGAKYLLVLSRRERSPQDQQSLLEEVHLANAHTTICFERCDISSHEDVHNIIDKYSKDESCPIRGVVNSTVVLQDRTLENMTLADFQTPLLSKHMGTKNLIEAVQHHSLQFFIMLSSIVGILGGRGQANYAAGNTYQDAVAQYELSKGRKSETPYFALDLGFVEGTSAMAADSSHRERQNSLRRQGCIPIKMGELRAFLEYFISGQARKNGCKQVLIGVDSQSLADAASLSPTAKSPLFCHVWVGEGDDDHDAKSASQQSDGGAVQTLSAMIAKSTDEAQMTEIVEGAVARKMASLLGRKENTLSRRDEALADLGVDSLLAIELKNWFSTELGAMMHASEVMDMPNITALVAEVVKRAEFSRHRENGGDTVMVGI